MAFDPRLLPPQPFPQLPSQLSSHPPNLNPNHQQPLSHYNFAYPNPNSETTGTNPAEVTLAQQHYFYQHGAEASRIPSASVANAGQYNYRGESVLEISPITSIYMGPPHILPQERNGRYRYKAKQKKFKKEGKVVQPLHHCAVCKINCDTQAVLDCHKQGKPHKKNLQKLKDAITPKPEKSELEKKEPERSEPEKLQSEAERLKPKAPQPLHCKVCDVYCDTEQVLGVHEAGKKHKKTASKTDVVAEPAYCQICSVLCTGQEDLNNHLRGKNHKKKLEHQAPDASKSEDGNSKRMKRKAAGDPALRHVQAMRCDICHVEVNSEIVYESHVAGSKHAAMVKKLQQVKAVACEENGRC